MAPIQEGGKSEITHEASDASPTATAEAKQTSSRHDQSEARERRVEQLLQEYGSTWDGPDDPSDPYNWPRRRKVLTGLIYSLAQLVTLMSASMITAALNDIARDLRVDPSSAQIVFSTYFLGLGFGPFVIAAFSEMHGRKWVWVLSNVWFILWNAISPIGYSLSLMIVGRLMTGIGACAGVTLTGPVMADMYGKRDRGKAAAITALLPSLGPALGPIVGGLVTERVVWPWIFRIMSIATAVVTLIGTLYIKESYTPTLLRRKTRGHGVEFGAALHWSFWEDFLSRFRLGVWRPIRLLLKRPVIQLIAFMLGLSFAIYTILLGSYATLFIDRYRQTPSIASLHYIAIAAAATIAAQVGGRVMDWSYRRLSDRRNNGEGKPEYRAPYLISGVVACPVGLVLYGWAAEYTLPWPVVDLGAAIYSLGSIIVSQMLYAYMLDEFVEHGASANAASRIFSYTLGFAFPIFAPDLYGKLGFGWGNNMLSLLWVVFFFPLPAVIWFWGDRIRKWGRKDSEARIDGI
ncbi:major facilitator superfamily domain-containing protein [Apiospora arundinis]